MTTNSINVRCTCGHVWTERFDMPMPVKLWCDRFKSIACPECHAKIENITLARKEAA